jgi:hypothetical protein
VMVDIPLALVEGDADAVVGSKSERTVFRAKD